MMFTGRGIIFMGLNAVRLLSLLALILVFASNILVMVHDIQAVNHFQASGGNIDISTANSTDITDTTDTTDSFDCGYIDGSTVPNQAAGVFWAVLNRLLILFECVVLMLAEVGFPMSFFNKFFPILGSDFGLGALGVFQCLIGAAVLSHQIGEFALVAAFLLFSIGCVNIFLGLIFREKAKLRRNLNPAKSDLLPSSLKAMTLGGSTEKFPTGFHNVTLSRAETSSQYSHASTEKSVAPPYGYQAQSAFGKAQTVLGRAISVRVPEESHPNPQPKVSFAESRNQYAGRPSFGSSAEAV